MAKIWPPSIDRGILQSGFAQQAVDHTIRSKMEAGIDKLRSRYTSPILNSNISMIVDVTQYTALETFYNTTLEKGKESFNYTDPFDNTEYEYRMIGPPAYSVFNGLHYVASMVWERI